MATIHKPSIPVRKDVIGEVVFMKMWEKINKKFFFEADGHLVSFLDHILKSSMYAPRRKATEREALVAASFIKWLGTNCGRSFLEEMLEMRDRHPFSYHEQQEACVDYWKKKNVPDKRSSYRLIQTIIAKKSDYRGSSFPGTSQLSRYVSYNSHDIEVIEHVCRFLGSDEGLIFTSTCTNDIEAHWAEELEKVLEKFSLKKVSE